MRLHRLLARLLVGLALGALAARAAAPDEAQASDPFGFLEDAGDPQTQVYLRHEAELTERALERLPGRNDLEARIRALSRSGTTVSALALAGSRVFYLKLEPERMNPVLCVRNGLDSAERVLVDPERFTREGKRAAIDWFVPSPEAHYVAYGISYGGSGDSVLRVVATDTGSDLPLAIDRARFNARLAWHPDGRSFYYTRLPETPKEAPSEANMRIYRHLIGRESASDEVVFAPGVGGAIDVPRIDYPYFVVPADSRYAYAIAREGVRPEIAVHVTEQKDLAKARPRWRKIVGVQDAVTAIEAWKDDLYLLSHRGAPRYRVLQLNASQPDLAHARVVVPQGDAVIQSMGLAADALYLRTM
ncbi:MAG TPA: hypothetical protein VN878_05540, partial [Usitatibacter sp.]|nr:hypothetical protein [Usitatibacter sp.]